MTGKMTLQIEFINHTIRVNLWCGKVFPAAVIYIWQHIACYIWLWRGSSPRLHRLGKHKVGILPEATPPTQTHMEVGCKAACSSAVTAAKLKYNTFILLYNFFLFKILTTNSLHMNRTDSTVYLQFYSHKSNICLKNEQFYPYTGLN